MASSERIDPMLIGHYAPALVLQRLRPSLKLAPLFVAAQLAKANVGSRDGGQCFDEVCVAPGYVAIELVSLSFVSTPRRASRPSGTGRQARTPCS